MLVVFIFFLTLVIEVEKKESLEDKFSNYTQKITLEHC